GAVSAIVIPASSDHGLAGVVRYHLADRDEDEDGQDDKRHAAIVEHRHLAEEDQAEPACSHKTHDGRAADIDVPLEYDRADDDRQYLRHDAVIHDLELVAADRTDRLDGLRIDVLDRLGGYLGDEADRTHGDGKDAGQRTEADRADEEQRPDDLVDRAGEHHHQASDRVEDVLVRRDVRGAEPGDGERQEAAQYGAERRHHEGFERRNDELGQQRPIDLEEARQRAADPQRAAHALPVGVEHDGVPEAPGEQRQATGHHYPVVDAPAALVGKVGLESVLRSRGGGDAH